MENNRLEAVIDTASLKHNYKILTQNTENSRVISVIKANAYGHGAVECAKVLSECGCDMFAVACVDEGIELRNGGISADILILGVTPVNQMELVSSYGFIQTVPSVEYGELVAKTGVNIRCHLKIDTGMTRIGLYCHSEKDFEASYRRAKKILEIPNIKCEGVFTHFACADTRDTELTNKQFDAFNGFCNYCKIRGLELGMRHCCNSAATVRFPQMHLDGVRLGIMLYGLSPNPEEMPVPQLKLCMTLKANIVQISHVKKGDTVSYGGVFTAPEDMDVAAVSIGYADGLHRVLSGKASFVVNNSKAPVLGRICMDMTMCDVTNIDCKVGDSAFIFCDSQTPDELAALAQTIGYELVSAVSHRVKREYI